MTDSTHITLTAPPTVNMALVVGAGDCLLHIIEEAFDTRITVRGDSVVLEGDPVEVQSLMALFSELFKFVEGGGAPDEGFLQRALDLLRTAEFTPSMLREDILLTYRGRAIRPKTAGQKHYVDAIRKNTITFGIGPAGTGKTYLAMAMAVAALKRKEVGRIILTRPVVEAGENLGFLPGTLNEKVDPYIRPLYDALFDMTDMERAQQLDREQRHRDRAFGLHARTNAQRQLRHLGRGAKHHARADEDVPHTSWIRVEDGHHRRCHPA